MSFGEDSEKENKQYLANFDAGLESQGIVHKTVPSGISGFDEALGEGLVEGNIYLLISDSGEHSKQISHQILYHRIISKSRVTYYTFEDSSADIIEEMAHYNMHIQKFVDEGTWKFVRIVSSDLKQIIDTLPEHPLDEKVSLEGDIGDLINHFSEQMKKNSNTIMQFTHLIRELTPLQIQQLMLYIKGLSRKYGGIHFIVLNKGGDYKEKEFVLRDLADSVFDVTTSIKGEILEITTTIKKARKMKVNTRKLNLIEKNGELSTSTIQRI